MPYSEIDVIFEIFSIEIGENLCRTPFVIVQYYKNCSILVNCSTKWDGM